MDKKVLELYNQGLSRNAIANQIQKSYWYVNNVLDKNGIPKERRMRKQDDHIPSKEELEKLYFVDMMSQEDIRKKYNTSNTAIKLWFRRYGIKKRSHSENQSIFMKKAAEKYKEENGYYLQQKHISIESVNILDDKEKLCSMYEKDNMSSETISMKLGVSPSLVLSKLHEYGVNIKPTYSSKYEYEIIDFLNEIGIKNIVHNTKSIIPPYEIDVYLPDHDLAIEFNGVYWHSFKKPNYHLQKTERCESKNIHLLHISEHEWIHKTDIWKSIIQNKLKLNTNKFHARKCSIRELTIEEEREFFNQNHIQGYIQSSVCYGLLYDDKVISAMSFGIPRFNKDVEWEILRFSNLCYTSVIGSFNKLLNQFTKNNVPKSIISYANRRWSMGNIYELSGFTFVRNSRPNYVYVKNDVVYTRQKCQKHKLEKLLEKFDPNMSESENMINNGYYKLYDCGNKVYIKSF